jgi:hypothetical protein
MWRHEAERAAPNVARMRTIDAFREELPATQDRFIGLARAAILTIPGPTHTQLLAAARILAALE